MDRIRTRIALFLAAAAVSGVFVAASPAIAQESCYPYPEQYCNTMDWYEKCVLWRIIYGYSDPSCRS